MAKEWISDRGMDREKREHFELVSRVGPEMCQGSNNLLG